MNTICAGLTKDGTRCKRKVKETYCYAHIPKEECIICVENNPSTKCTECNFTFCVTCYAKLGRYPQCRHVYNSTVDRDIRSSITTDANIALLESEEGGDQDG